MQIITLYYTFYYDHDEVPPFALKTASLLHSIDSTGGWKHSFEVLVHVFMIAFLQIFQVHFHVVNLLFCHRGYEGMQQYCGIQSLDC